MTTKELQDRIRKSVEKRVGQALAPVELFDRNRQDRCMWCRMTGRYGTWPGSGKRMLATPDVDGELVLDGDGHWREYDETAHENEQRFTAHWSKCKVGKRGDGSRF